MMRDIKKLIEFDVNEDLLNAMSLMEIGEQIKIKNFNIVKIERVKCKECFLCDSTCVLFSG